MGAARLEACGHHTGPQRLPRLPEILIEAVEGRAEPRWDGLALRLAAHLPRPRTQPSRRSRHGQRREVPAGEPGSHAALSAGRRAEQPRLKFAGLDTRISSLLRKLEAHFRRSCALPPGSLEAPKASELVGLWQKHVATMATQEDTWHRLGERNHVKGIRAFFRCIANRVASSC